MEKIYTYKLQGDGRDSWVCDEVVDGVLINRYMVFEDPNKPIEVNIDIDSLSDEQIIKLKQRFDSL
jgi:hypothetical protein